MANFANTIDAGTLPGSASPATATSRFAGMSAEQIEAAGPKASTNTVADVELFATVKPWKSNPVYGPTYAFNPDGDWYKRITFMDRYSVNTPYAADLLKQYGNPIDAFIAYKAVHQAQYDIAKAAGAPDGYGIGQAAMRTDEAMAMDIIAAMQGQTGWAGYSNFGAQAAIINGDRSFNFSDPKNVETITTPTIAYTDPSTGETQQLTEPEWTAITKRDVPDEPEAHTAAPIADDGDCGCHGEADTVFERLQNTTTPVLKEAVASETIKAEAPPIVPGVSSPQQTVGATSTAKPSAITTAPSAPKESNLATLLLVLAGVAISIKLLEG